MDVRFGLVVNHLKITFKLWKIFTEVDGIFLWIMWFSSSCVKSLNGIKTKALFVLVMFEIFFRVLWTKHVKKIHFLIPWDKITAKHYLFPPGHLGGDIQPKRDLSRFVKWPKYIRLQRQKTILYQRLKVPPSINQFTQTLDKQTGMLASCQMELFFFRNPYCRLQIMCLRIFVTFVFYKNQVTK